MHPLDMKFKKEIPVLIEKYDFETYFQDKNLRYSFDFPDSPPSKNKNKNLDIFMKK